MITAASRLLRRRQHQHVRRISSVAAKQPGVHNFRDPPREGLPSDTICSLAPHAKMIRIKTPQPGILSLDGHRGVLTRDGRLALAVWPERNGSRVGEKAQSDF
jgi:hypothetical protein